MTHGPTEPTREDDLAIQRDDPFAGPVAAVRIDRAGRVVAQFGDGLGAVDAPGVVGVVFDAALQAGVAKTLRDMLARCDAQRAPVQASVALERFGGVREIVALAMPLPNGERMLSLHDATPLLRRHRREARRLATLVATIDAMPMIAILLDADARVVGGNKAWNASQHREEVARVCGVPPWHYVEACLALGVDNAALRTAAHGVRAIVEDEKTEYECVYEQAVQGVRRSYQLRAVDVAGGDGVRVLVTHEDVTERVSSAHALRDSERLLRTVLRAMPVGVSVVDERGGTVMSNPAARAMTGAFRIADQVGHGNVKLRRADGTPLEKGELPTERALRTGQPIYDEVLHVEGDGMRPRVVSCSVLPIPSGPRGNKGAVSLQLDITERTRAETKLRESERQLRGLLTSVMDGIVGFDVAQRAVFCNPAAETVLGLAEDRILGASCESLFGAATARALTDGTGSTHEVRLTLPDGHAAILEVAVTRTGVEQHAATAVLSVRDVSQRHAMLQQLSQAQKLEAIGQLAAGIAHEINTPSQFIGDNLRFLRAAMGDLVRVVDAANGALAMTEGEQRKALAELGTTLATIDWAYLRTECPLAVEQSLDGVERVSRIVSSMKDFSHPDSAEKQAMDLNRVVVSAVNVSRNEWKYVAEVQTDLATDLPSVPGFAGDLSQVLLNLIVNAAHAIAERKGPMGRITIRTTLADGGVELSVADNGAGIPEAAKPRIFTQFFTTKPVGKGTGQGLSLVRRILIDRHGGRVWFESTEGVGTTFFLWLPI